MIHPDIPRTYVSRWLEGIAVGGIILVRVAREIHVKQHNFWLFTWFGKALGARDTWFLSVDVHIRIFVPQLGL